MGIISYAGGLCVSIAADRVPSSEGVARRICEGFERRFEEYVAVAREVVEKEKEKEKRGGEEGQDREEGLALGCGE